MAFVGSFAIGMIYSVLFGLMAVFGAKIGLSIFQISILVFVNDNQHLWGSDTQLKETDSITLMSPIAGG